MVHALKESWRVLKQAGWLIDLRPYSLNPPVEVIVNDTVHIAGPIDGSAGVPDDEAADKAIKAVIKDGMYSKSAEGSFKFAYYWDSLKQMTDYIEERWSDYNRLPEETLEKAGKLASDHQGVLQIRIQSNLKIRRYKKQGK